MWYLYYDYDTATTKDVDDLCYISESHASNLLREMWKKGWLSRKVEYVKPHGRRFRYHMTQKGLDLFLWLCDKKVFEE